MLMITYDIKIIAIHPFRIIHMILKTEWSCNFYKLNMQKLVSTFNWIEAWTI